MLFKIGTKNSLTKTAYISRRKQSFPPILMGQVANSIGNKKQVQREIATKYDKTPIK
jgi:hypothetical protein